MRTLVFACAVLALSVSAPAQYWTGPYPIASDSSDEINPSACKEWVNDCVTCMVWQTNRNGNWDVCAAFCDFHNGNGWQAAETLSLDTLDDVNPSVTCRSYYYPDSTWFWCFWERRLGSHVGEIRASFSDMDSWREPVRIGRSLHGAPQDSSEPCGIVMPGDQDTTFVIWNNRDTSGSYISYSLHDGDSWSTPGIVAWSVPEIRHTRIGRVSYYRGDWYSGPMVVWEQEGNIWCSEFRNGLWTAPESIALHRANDCDPEVASCPVSGGGEDCGVVWMSERDGDSAIYGVRPDSIRSPFRLCDSTGGEYDNWTPQAVEILFPIEWWGPTAVWVTDRNGNPDIYSTSLFDHDAYVDTHPSADLHPTVTTMGMTQAWCCWQTDRNGNWDIYGSYVYATGIGGKEEVTRTKDELLMPTLLAQGRLRLPLSADRSQPAAVLHDPVGRVVMRLQPGDNDVSYLSPGVYFIQLNAVGGRRPAVTKVLVTN